MSRFVSELAFAVVFVVCGFIVAKHPVHLVLSWLDQPPRLPR